eukprot:TRINITY_DN105042_c0_g1_i1.p1 TRINITY_DN105042_c0_g1~~TRINITY_DN105042_c0_g1_i1.p1  ORF type:complete len:153 (+),score=16.22 TRINITY_DN105042_c0_g1_i1:126-584(+)
MARTVLLALGCSLAFVGQTHAFNFGQPLQTQRVKQKQLQPVVGLSDSLKSQLTGVTQTVKSSAGFASRTLATGVIALVAMMTAYGRDRKRKRNPRAMWRKTVRSRSKGHRGWAWASRPTLLGPSEKPPYEGKRMYHYYCNKIYKVIRDDITG